MNSGQPGSVSEREAQVLAAIGEHLSNAQIARRLHISVRTVESHVSSLLRKVGVGDRQALAAMAGEAGARTAAVRSGTVVGVPLSRTTFVGRDGDRDAVISALAEARVVSLLGPGGVGKTRLAAEVAHVVAPSFPAGGAFVDLVPVRQGFVTRALASALGVIERATRALDDAVVERLRHGRSLLVLDNCEHLIDEVGVLVERVLSACAQVTVLATSRERLSVPGERAVHIPPLPLASDAEQLFADRARAVDPDLDADPAVISRLCARLDGMPLAIELAAARSASLGVDGLLAGMEDRLRLLAGGRGPERRHHSLRAVMEWSHDLLDDDEQALFRRVSVFASWFDLAAATAISPGSSQGAVADLIGRLVDKSLVVRGRGADPTRWRMLETIHAFAADKLAGSGERETTRLLHLRWATAAAAALEARLTEAAPTATWQAAFDEVADELRATCARTAPVPDATAHGLARSLAHLTFARGLYREAHGHYRAAAERAEDAATAFQDLRSAAHTAMALSQGPAALPLLLHAADPAGPAADPNARTVALAEAVIVLHRFLAGFNADAPLAGTVARLDEAAETADLHDPRVAALLAAARAWAGGGKVGAPDLALSRAAVDAARQADDPLLLLAALDALGVATVEAGRIREAQRIAEERLRLVETLPWHEPSAAVETIDALQVAAISALCAGDLPAALAVARRLQADHQAGDHPHVATAHAVVALSLSGRFDDAVETAAAMWQGWQQVGTPMEWLSVSVASVALVHGLRGDEAFDHWRARTLEVAGVTDPTRSRSLMAFSAFVEARVALHAGRVDDARSLVDRAFAAFPRLWYQGYARAAGAELAVVAGLPDAAERLAAAARDAAENDWAAACLARAAGRLHDDPEMLSEAVDRWERIDARFERACTLLLLPGRAAEGHAELRALVCPFPGRPARPTE